MTPVICLLLVASCVVCLYAEHAYRRWLAARPPISRHTEED